MEPMIQIVGMPMDQFWAEMDKRYGKPEPVPVLSGQDELMTTSEAMVHKGYKQHVSFKKFLRRHGIIPYTKKKNVKLYKKSDLDKPHQFV